MILLRGYGQFCPVPTRSHRQELKIALGTVCDRGSTFHQTTLFHEFDTDEIQVEAEQRPCSSGIIWGEFPTRPGIYPQPRGEIMNIPRAPDSGMRGYWVCFNYTSAERTLEASISSGRELSSALMKIERLHMQTESLRQRRSGGLTGDTLHSVACLAQIQQNNYALPRTE